MSDKTYEQPHALKSVPNETTATNLPAPSSLAPATGSVVGGDFYNGIEWLACWLLDNVEGETITEEQLRPWAVKAWEAHMKRQNDEVSGASPLR